MRQSDPYAAYRAARSRFVRADVIEDGEPRVRLSDPVLNVAVSVRIDQADALPMFFKGEWMRRYTQSA